MELHHINLIIHQNLTSNLKMCGIWGYIASNLKKEKHDIGVLFESFMKVQKRGPDRSDFKILNEIVKIYLGFHRLSIMDKSTAGDQPFTLEYNDRSIYTMCNGEIYNYKQLIKENDIIVKSGSDCEVIQSMYIKYGFQGTLERLVGEFAICIFDIDHTNNTINFYCGRDQTGVRPLFIGIDEHGIGFSSILGGLIKIIDPDKIRQLNRAEILSVIIESDGTTKYMTNIYHKLEEIQRNSESDFKNMDDLGDIQKEIRSRLIEAVICRLNSDCPIGALLSGGLDSSLVVSIAANYLKKKGERLRTFSVGIPGSTDRKYAEMAAVHCGTDHTHVEFTEMDFLKARPKIVEVTETIDITTVRASTGHYLIAKWIRENTDIKVVIGGDGSDEVCSGYMYFHNAPSALESHKENIRLVENIGFFDVLRADRSIASNGLETRVPFLHHPFVEYYLSLPPHLRIPTKESENGRKIEKWLLRKAFDGLNDDGVSWLPDEILWRIKEAFSDGVSGIENSLHKTGQKDVENMFTQKDFESEEVKFHIEPKTKEALHIRILFNKLFHFLAAKVIPYYWMPNFSGDVKDPSARVLLVNKY